MAWTLEVSKEARRQLRKIDRQYADRITRAMIGVAGLSDPRQRGISMTGNYTGYWRYRVSDHRVVAKIEEERIVISVIAVGHRREVYR